MADEFQESDVIFSDHRHDHHDEDSSSFFDNFRDAISQAPRQHHHHHNKQSNNKVRKSGNKMVASSLPVNIPEDMFRCIAGDDVAEEEWEEDGMVPPHVLVARRIAGKMAFSVCTGNGRTLKGRDLSRVRNSILRMTGFLET